MIDSTIKKKPAPFTVLVLPRSRGKIEKSFSPKLTDYFIQGVRNIQETIYGLSITCGLLQILIRRSSLAI